MAGLVVQDLLQRVGLPVEREDSVDRAHPQSFSLLFPRTEGLEDIVAHSAKGPIPSSRHQRLHFAHEAIHRGEELVKAATALKVDLEGVQARGFPVAQ
jgi:hypothetical protein